MIIPDFNHLKKNLKKPIEGFKVVRIALVCDMASQFISMAIKGYGIENGINFEIFEADYNQIDRQIFDAGSELYAHQPQCLVLLRGTERLGKYFYQAGKTEKLNFAHTQVEYLERLYQTLSGNLPLCRVITNTYIELNDGVFGNFAAKTNASLLYQLRMLNLRLMDMAQTHNNLFLLDIAALTTATGYHQTFDAKMYYRADMVFSIDFVPYLAKNTTDIILSIAGSFKKCVVLDLDNTLWGGIIGDDGMEGIQIGTLGNGKIFTELQLWVKQLKERGIIVTVCSKNTEDIAWEPFRAHPEMVLKPEDIALFVANWENKADNIRYIQQMLNIGMDSMVFIDDNPFEREMVKMEIPEITVPDLPEDAAEYLLFLKSLNLFETASYTESDELRTQQYQTEIKRNIVLKSFANEHEFLADLEMISEVKPFDVFSIPRVAQLSQRSNQFNLRTVRYNETDLFEIVKKPNYYTYTFTLADKYGDNGLIAFVVLKQEDNNTLFIENWAMSCRVLKRGMEQFVLICLQKEALAKGFTTLTGEYIPTKKNAIVKDHYPSLGFQQIAENLWQLDLSTFVVPVCYVGVAKTTAM